MFRYNGNRNFDRKPVKRASRRPKNQQSNKNKDKGVIPSIKNEIFEVPEEEYDEVTFHEKHIPKTWKETWQKPLNQDLIQNESTSYKIRTDTRNKRMNSRRSAFMANMLTSDY